MLFSGWYDTSGTESGRTQKVLLTAGVIAHADKWERFDKEWMGVLKEFGVAELHMKHFVQSKEQFTSWKGDEPRRIEFLSRLTSRRREGAADDDVSERQRQIEQIEQLQERVARMRVTIARLRAELDGVPYEEVRGVGEVPPLIMTCTPPARPPRKSSGRRKGSSDLDEARVQRRSDKLPLVPIPLRVVEQRVICRYGHRTISLPIVEERVVLSSGLQATIQKIATTRIKGLAVGAFMNMPAKKRRPGRRRKGSSGDAVRR
jgi:hypothetical protein